MLTLRTVSIHSPYLSIRKVGNSILVEPCGICLALDFKTTAGIVSVNLQGKLSQRKKVDSIGILENREIAVLGADPDHIRDASQLPASGAKPENIVITPLDILAMTTKTKNNLFISFISYFFLTGSQVSPHPSFLNILRSTSESITVECT